MTKTGKLTPEAFTRREEQWSNVYLKDFKKQGAIVFKLLYSPESADQLVKIVLGRVQEDERVLRIQEELVELARSLPATDAGRELKYTLGEIMEHQKKALAGDNLTEEQITAHKQKITTIASQIKQLKLSFSQRVLKFFGLVSCFAFSLSMYGHLSLCLRAVEEDATGLWSPQDGLLDLNLVQSICASHRAHNIIPFYFLLLTYFHTSRIYSHLLSCFGGIATTT